MTSQEKLQKAMEYAFANRPIIGGFPFLAECLRIAGAAHNIWSLPGAQSTYIMRDGSWVINQGAPLVLGMVEVPLFNQEKIIEAIAIDKEGKSTFPEFLQAIWNAGATGYDVDFNKHTVTYMGTRGELYTESYPVVTVDELVLE